MTREIATLIGFGAIVLWSLLAVLTDLTGDIPPFQLAALSFSIGGVSGLLVMTLRRRTFRVFRQPAPVWLLGVGGLFGYHFLYFSALFPIDQVLLHLNEFIPGLGLRFDQLTLQLDRLLTGIGVGLDELASGLGDLTALVGDGFVLLSLAVGALLADFDQSFIRRTTAGHDQQQRNCP